MSILLKHIKNEPEETAESVPRGRQKLNFMECSTRTKRRRIAQLVEIDETAVSALRNENQTQNVLPADPKEVISLLMETGMTKHQYLLIRNFVNSKTLIDFFPSYKCILSSKKERYPDNISVDESYAEVELQSSTSLEHN